MTRPALLLVTSLLLVLPGSAAARRPHVFRVCNRSTVACNHGRSVRKISRAIKRAKPGDWVLIWPGVYHEKATDGAGVMVTTPDIHIRGMDRNLVIIDGSNGTAAGPCPADASLQDLTGRNGIEVFKASGVSVDNLTVCNYLAHYGHGGNEVWWNGGDGSGTIGMGSYSGAFLTTTSMFYQAPDAPMAMYGIFVSNARGPGSITDSYASNMGDSDFYVGACPDCNATLSNVHAQNSSLGYSGTNSGGHLIIEDSEWDQNKTGIVPNSLNNDDKPPPQNGQCPGGTGSCTIIRRNHVHHNNNPNVPAAGISGEAPVGAGIEISGGMFDTVQDNLVENQGAWGIVTHDFPDTDMTANCEGGINSGGVCLFEAKGNVVTGNTLQNNGFFGNPTNGDLANESSSTPRNCFYGNTDPGGLTSEPPMIETVDGPPCDQQGVGSGPLAQQLACDAGIIPSCPGYPRPTQVQMFPLMRQTPMPDPCAGVPPNHWCPYVGPRS